MPRMVIVLFAGLLAGLAVVCLVYGFASGRWMGGLYYASVIGAAIGVWQSERRRDDAARVAADSLIAFVFLLALGVARPAFEYLGL